MLCSRHGERRVTVKRFNCLIVLVALALVVAGCGGSSKSSSSSSSPSSRTSGTPAAGGAANAGRGGGRALMDLNALWKSDGGPLTSVTKQGADQVAFNFASPAQPYLWFVANLTPILPQHIGSGQAQSKLHSFSDKQPVGTGPYTVSNCTPQ